MPEKMTLRQRKQRMKTTNAWLFGYALVVGTSAPVVLSRCRANCPTCGGCILLLGILPLALILAAPNRLRRTIRKIRASFQIGKKTNSTAGPR